MIIGAHSIVYSMNADADRAFFRDVLKLGSIDMGGGWLIFGLPPAEVALHPADKNDVHEFYLMCENVEELVAELEQHGVASTPVADHGWGLVVHVTLPGGGRLGIYEPRHPRPVSAAWGEKGVARGGAGGGAEKGGGKIGKGKGAAGKRGRVGKKGSGGKPDRAAKTAKKAAAKKATAKKATAKKATAKKAAAKKATAKKRGK